MKSQWSQTALIACILANSNRDPKRKPTPFKIEDFDPFHESSKNRRKRKPDMVLSMDQIKAIATGKKIFGVSK